MQAQSHLKPVSNQDTSPDPGMGGGGGDDGVEKRLRELENKVVRLEEKVDNINNNMATKTDIEKIKVWVLSGILSAVVLSATIASLIFRFF